MDNAKSRTIAGDSQSRMFNAVFYLLIIALLFAAILLMTHTSARVIDTAAELGDFDFSAGIALVSPYAFDRYPNVLYTPEDFAGGRAAGVEAWDHTNPGFATYRLVIDNLIEGKVYGISGYSATHAMYLWVDGVLLAAVGRPGESYRTMISHTNYFTVYFTAGALPVEVIIQRSSHILAHGGLLSPLYFGEQHQITAMHTLSHVRISIIIGITLMAALFYIGIFLFFKNQLRFMWFSLVCLAIALRTIGIDLWLSERLMPALDWQGNYLIGYLSTSAFVVFVILYIDAMYGNMLNRALKWGAILVLGTHAAFMLATPPNVYSRIEIVYINITIFFCLAILFNMAWLFAKHREKWHTEHTLVLFGACINVVLGGTEVMILNYNPHAIVNYILVGAMVFIFVNTIALALYFHRTEAELAIVSKQRREHEAIEQRLASDNATLDSLSRMKTEYLANMSHEIKTPLAIISGDVQRAARLLERDGVENERVSQSLARAKEEIMRVARLTENALRMAAMQESRERMRPLNATTLFTANAEAYRSIIGKRGNILRVRAQENLPYLYGNADQLIQVLTNLLTNANRHTKDGVIMVSIKLWESDGWQYIAVTVKDDGAGVPTALLPTIFERGISGSGSTGVGLTISKRIVHAHGGTITAESEPGKGCAITFTIPVAAKNRGEPNPADIEEEDNRV
ncbi:MAG: sensor histidine kinase [Oscillospiraceae bacterium]|nr:sensor histidine kinase [Oscillospiraceae bacterium]